MVRCFAKWVLAAESIIHFEGVKRVSLKRIISVIISVLLLIAAAGCGKTAQQTSVGNSNSEQVLRLGSVFDFKSATEGKNLIMEFLVKVDHEGNPVPALAESWDISDDGKIYTFHLRKGVRFHNGTPFNASAAKFAFEWMANSLAFGAYVDKTETPDDNTLKVYLKQNYSMLLLNLAGGSSTVICAEAVEPAGSTNGKLTNFIGTGPFKLVSYEKDKEAVLARNDQYWGTKPKVDKVVWKTIPDSHAQIVALKAGEIDMVGITEHHSSVPYVEVPGLKKAGINIEVKSYGRYQVLEYNCQRELFMDKNVRMAFNYAIDKGKMVKELFGGLAEPAYTITAPWFKYGPSEVKIKYSYDLDKAKQLLTEAGWQDSNSDGILDKNGKPLTFELLIPAGEANADAVAIFVQSELKKIGVDMKLLTMENGAAWDRSRKGDYDMFVHHSFCLPSIPGAIGIGDKYHSKAKSWPSAYHSAELDQLLENAFTVTTEDAKRKELCNQAWDILHEQAPCIPLYDIVKVVAFRDNISGFKPGPTMFDMLLNDIEVKQQAK